MEIIHETTTISKGSELPTVYGENPQIHLRLERCGVDPVDHRRSVFYLNFAVESSPAWTRYRKI